LKFTTSLKKNYEFRRLYAKGKCASTPCLAVYVRFSRKNTNQVGITVTNKLGKAVVRNRVRRRLREIYRLNEESLARGFDMVVVARMKSRTASYGELEGDFLKACGKLGLLGRAEGQGE